VDNKISLEKSIMEEDEEGQFTEFEAGYKKVQEICTTKGEKWKSLPQVVKNHARKHIMDR